MFILLAIVSCYIWNTLYCKYLEPGGLFFSACLESTRHWSSELRKQAAPCYVFSGGSEVRMGIETRTMHEKHGVRAINAGVQAGNGVRCNAQIALPFLQQGDTLLISYIPGSDTLVNEGMAHEGINFCHTQQGFSPFIDGILPLSHFSIASLFTGSATNYAIHIMRLLTRPDCIYRYSSPKNARISDTGRAEVFLTTEQSAIIKTISCDENSEVELKGWPSLLKDLRNYCEKKDINLVVYISRAHIASSEKKRNAAAALCFMKIGIPVLKDPYLGCWEDSEMFSDTSLHLSIEGGRIFSEFIALQLKNQQYWNKDELEQIIKDSK